MRKRVSTLSEVKVQIGLLRGKEVALRVHLGRNKYQSLKGIVSEVYPALFTVKSQDEIKSYSYFAVACGDVELARAVKN